MAIKPASASGLCIHTQEGNEDSEQSGCRVLKKEQGKALESGRGSEENDYSFVLPSGFFFFFFLHQKVGIGWRLRSLLV